jgi:hypothetical protein
MPVAEKCGALRHPGRAQNLRQQDNPQTQETQMQSTDPSANQPPDESEKISPY